MKLIIERGSNCNLGCASKELKIKKKKLNNIFIRFSDDVELESRQGKSKWLKTQKYAQGKIKSSDTLKKKVKSSVVLEAEELRSKLNPKYPSFIKSLLRSHVTSCFWMGLPAPFCRAHLPHEDTSLTLESQNKKTYNAKYLVRKTGLSSGWRTFAMAERLLAGDVLVFHLVSATKFKIYVIRGKDLTEVDGALLLLNSDTHTEQSNRDMNVGSSEQNNRIHQVSETEVGSSGVANGFSDITSFENFKFVMNEFLKGYQLPKRTRWSYYKLCYSQNSFLHAHVPKQTNHILIAGIIIEIVDIADAMRNCELSTFCDEFPLWEKALGSFKRMGMKIGFMFAHLDRLKRIACDPKVAIYRQKYSQLSSQNARTEDEITSLQTRISETKKVYKSRAANIEDLQNKMENRELKFQEQVSAPW